MSDKLKWSVPDHTGFIHPEQAKEGELEGLFQSPLEKFNHCHGAKGQFCSSGGGSGGGGSAAEEKVAPHARTELAPLVGQRVAVDYWVEKSGRTGQDRCLRDIKIKGTDITIQHIWAQKIPKEIKNAKYGEKQTAYATVQKYTKKAGSDYTIQGYESIIRKEVPLISLEKYNHCHGANGKFCSSGSGGAGGASAPAAGSEEFTNQNEFSPEYLNATSDTPEEVTMAITESKSFTLLRNKQGVDEETALAVVDHADNTAGKTQVKNLKTMELAPIAEPTAFAECEFTFWPDGNKVASKETLRVDMHPDKLEMATKGWQEDRAAVKEGKLPWLASGYSHTEEGNRQALLNHEVGHAVLGEHTIKQPAKNWVDADNPLMGTKEWHGVVSNAAKEGWVGASMYGRQNLGEMFAESFALLNIRSSTGSKSVDDYVLKVVKNG